MIQKAAVLGAGTMGRGIAALLAMNGIDVCLFDLAEDGASGGFRSRLAQEGLERLKQAYTRPSDSAWISRITAGNFQDDLGMLADTGWVIESVVERRDEKAALYFQIAPYLSEVCILSSNTSGLSINDLTQVLPDTLRGRFLGTHFFNPPEHMKLVELIPSEDTRPDVIFAVKELLEGSLGKSALLTRDTPNFIVNRIGVMSILLAMKLLPGSGLSFRDADDLLGRRIGRPRNAVFHTADLIGLDTLSLVAETGRQRASSYAESELWTLPEYAVQMIRSGRLGQKSGGGFFRMDNLSKQEEYWEPESFCYKPVRTSRRFSEVPEDTMQLKTWAWRILDASGPEGDFLRRYLTHFFQYAAKRIPELAATPETIDFAMRLGYGWKMGPFQLWKALGVQECVTFMKQEEFTHPKWIDEWMISE